MEEKYYYTVNLKTKEGLLNNKIDEANAYLLSEDMAQYLDDDLIHKTNSMLWLMNDDNNGEIRIVVEGKLSNEDIENLVKFINGQNSDGLGEGFEQQGCTKRNFEFLEVKKDDVKLINKFDFLYCAKYENAYEKYRKALVYSCSLINDIDCDLFSAEEKAITKSYIKIRSELASIYLIRANQILEKVIK